MRELSEGADFINMNLRVAVGSFSAYFVLGVGIGASTCQSGLLFLFYLMCLVDPQWYCPIGYSLATNNVCFKREYVDLQYSCDAGFTMCSEGCCKINPYDAIKTCTEGTTWDESRQACVLQTLGPLQQVCPDEYEYCGPGICCYKKRVQASVTCPSNMEFDGSTCSRYASTDAEWNCPYGFTLTRAIPNNISDSKKGEYEKYSLGGQGVCVQSSQTVATTRCPAGSAEVKVASVSALLSSAGISCQITSSQSMQGTCKTGYIFDQKRQICVWTVETNPISVKCPDGYTINGDKLCSQTSTSLRSTTSTTTVTVPSEVACPTGFAASVTGTCSLEETSAATLFCPSGSTAMNGQCLSSSSVKLEYYCQSPTATLVQNVCVETLFSSIGWSCPKGGDLIESITEIKLSLSERSKCKKGTLDVSSNWGGEATIDEDCKYVSYPTRSCQLTISQDAVFSCPKNTILCEQGCCEEKMCDGTFICPTGTIPQSDGCITEALIAPAYTCPAGFTLSGIQCLEIATGTLRITCASGYNANSNQQCERLLTDDIRPLCPDGYYYGTTSGKCLCLMTSAGAVNVVAATTSTTTKAPDTKTVQVWATVVDGKVATVNTKK